MILSSTPHLVTLAGEWGSPGTPRFYGLRSLGLCANLRLSFCLGFAAWERCSRLFAALGCGFQACGLSPLA